MCFEFAFKDLFYAWFYKPGLKPMTWENIDPMEKATSAV